jgi:hypothetical protein
MLAELSSCHLRWMPAAEEKDYHVMYSIDGVHLAFKRQAMSNLQATYTSLVHIP